MHVDDLAALAKSGRRFGVIYADAAWPFATWGGESGKGRSVENHYGTSSIEEIMKLPVAALAANDCALLLWCIGPHIAIRSHVKAIEAWGFRPSTIAFDWIKQNPRGDGLHTGMGYWTRSNSEQCFIAIKGSPQRLATDVHQVVMAPVGEHSEKPDEVRRCIERLFPGPYLELYGRQPVESWTVWGNEIRPLLTVSKDTAPPETTAETASPPMCVDDAATHQKASTSARPAGDGLGIPGFLRRSAS